MTSGAAGICSSLAAWNTEASGMCSSGQRIAVSPVTGGTYSTGCSSSVDVQVDVEEDDQRPEQDRDQGRNDLSDRVVMDVVVIPGSEDADRQVDDGQQAGSAASVHGQSRSGCTSAARSSWREARSSSACAACWSSSAFSRWLSAIDWWPSASALA